MEATTDLILLENFKQPITNQCYPKEIIKNNSGESIAIKCSCGKYHPILGRNLRWGDEISFVVLSTMIERNVSYARILAEL